MRGTFVDCYRVSHSRHAKANHTREKGLRCMGSPLAEMALCLGEGGMRGMNYLKMG